jgi:hypothetical protein
MAKAGLIPAYVDQVAEALAFDRALARRVRREIADHLNEAAAAFPSRGEDAERLVLADFGDPGRIAAEFAAVSVAKQTKRAAAVVIVALGAAFAAMQARLAWYAFTQWTPPADTAGIGAIVGIVDRYAFWAALFIGIGGWLYASWQPMRGGFDARYRTTIGRSYAPCLAATAPLLLCVIADGILTGFRLYAAEPSAQFLPPAVAMAGEIACAAILLLQIRTVARARSFTQILQDGSV